METNRKLIKMNGSQLFEFMKDCNESIDEIVNGIKNGISDNDLNEIYRSIHFIECLKISLENYVCGSKYFKKQLFQNHKDINPKLTKEEVETLIENEKKDVIKEFKKYDLKFSINLDKHRNEVKNVDDRLLQLKLSDQHLNTEIRQLRFFLKQNESVREDIMENSKYLSK